MDFTFEHHHNHHYPPPPSNHHHQQVIQSETVACRGRVVFQGNEKSGDIGRPYLYEGLHPIKISIETQLWIRRGEGAGHPIKEFPRSWPRTPHAVHATGLQKKCIGGV